MYIAHMSSALNGSSALQCFKCGNAVEIRNEIMFNFLPRTATTSVSIMENNTRVKCRIHMYLVYSEHYLGSIYLEVIALSLSFLSLVHRPHPRGEGLVTSGRYLRLH